jgi:hypothetical protein
VYGQPDGPGLLRDGPADGLPDPPRRVGRELEALGVVELLDCPYQAGVALLHEVQQRHRTARVAPGDRDHEPQVGEDERVLGATPLGDQPLEFDLRHTGRDLLGFQQMLGVESGFDGLGEFNLLLGVQQWCAADLVQICTDEITVGHRVVVDVVDGNPLHLRLRVPRHRPPNRVCSHSELHNGSIGLKIPDPNRDLNLIEINVPKATSSSSTVLTSPFTNVNAHVA